MSQHPRFLLVSYLTRVMYFQYVLTVPMKIVQVCGGFSEHTGTHLVNKVVITQIQHTNLSSSVYINKYRPSIPQLLAHII